MSSDRWLIVGSLILLNGLANASIKMYLLLSLKLQILLFSLRYSLFISFPNGSLLTKFIENFYSPSLFSYLFENLFLFLLKLSPDTFMGSMTLQFSSPGVWKAWGSHLFQSDVQAKESSSLCWSNLGAQGIDQQGPRRFLPHLRSRIHSWCPFTPTVIASQTLVQVVAFP